MTRFRVYFFASLLAGLAACSKKEARTREAAAPASLAPAGKSGPSDPGVTLTGAMPDPINVDLAWKSAMPDAAGHVVEYTSDPKDEWVILKIMPQPISEFRHPDLAPETHFFYRIRPYFGLTSSTIDATTGKTPSDPGQGIVGDNDPVIDKPGPAELAQKKSLRNAATKEEAGPAELTGTFVSPVSLSLRWRDRAADEDGYLIEATTDPERGFDAVALLPADTISFTIPGLPPDTKCYFRVRAFYYGQPSNVVEETTGKEPAGYYQKRDAAAEAEAKKQEAKSKSPPEGPGPAPTKE
jgi:hypothetical protein